jgi:hypothetical protein
MPAKPDYTGCVIAKESEGCLAKANRPGEVPGREVLTLIPRSSLGASVAADVARVRHYLTIT